MNVNSWDWGRIRVLLTWLLFVAACAELVYYRFTAGESPSCCGSPWDIARTTACVLLVAWWTRGWGVERSDNHSRPDSS